MNVLKGKIAALSSDLRRLDRRLGEVVARRTGLHTSDRPELFREVTTVIEKIRKTQRQLHVAKRLLARAQGDEYELQLP